jgi:hypothetical protein
MGAIALVTLSQKLKTNWGKFWNFTISGKIKRVPVDKSTRK